MIELDEYDIAEMRAEDLRQRQYYSHLIRHPDCRDPDHPGCQYCRDDEEE